MKSVYTDVRWARLQAPREGGTLNEYRFANEYGSLVYRFIKKYVGCRDGLEYYDIASYRGAGGPIIEYVISGCEEEFMDAFVTDFDEYCKREHIIAEFAKLDPWSEYHELIERKCGAEYYGNFYCNNLSEDFYTLSYNRNARRAVKKAEAGGVVFQVDHTGATIPDFVRLYRNTEEKYHTGDYYNFDEADIRTYFDVFGADAFLVNAVLDGEVITSVLVVCGEDVAHYLLLGNNPEYLNLQCNSMLTYQTAMYTQKLGKKFFDMGGGKPGGNIELFKMNFVGEKGILRYSAVKRVRNQEMYDWFVEHKGEIHNSKFFPLYRG